MGEDAVVTKQEAVSKATQLLVAADLVGESLAETWTMRAAAWLSLADHLPEGETTAVAVQP